MSIVRLLAGFIVGFLACAILLFLISVRSPVTAPRLADDAVQTEEIAPVPAGTETASDEATPEPDAAPDPAPEPEPLVEPNEADNSTDQSSLQSDPAIAPADAPAAPTEPSSQDETPTAEDPPTQNSFSRVAGTLPTIGSGTSSRIRLSSEADPDASNSFGAFDLNAATFSPGNLPTLSVIFVDLGIEGVSRSELLRFDQVATFAIRADQEGADRASEDFRNAGYEVLMMPPAANSLTEADGNEGELVNAFSSIMPDAMGLIDVPAANLQRDAGSLRAVVNALSETGHALLTYDVGLNSANREAAKKNVPAAKIFRVLDGKDESENAILRQLDRAVLEANQEGAAIVLGHARQATVEAVRKWAGSSASSSVELAPVSVAIRKLIN